MKKYCEEVDRVYQIIDPGYQKERGTMLRALCEVAKILAKKYLNEGTETEEQFSERVKKCRAGGTGKQKKKQQPINF